jgi:hypothetical protein
MILSCRAAFAHLSPLVVGDAMNNLANTLKLLSRYEDALVLREKTLEHYRLTLPENHPDIGAL